MSGYGVAASRTPPTFGGSWCGKSQFPQPSSGSTSASRQPASCVTSARSRQQPDRHRAARLPPGRGQQQITVKHVTTNNVTADQAIIADSVTTGGDTRNVGSPALLPASSEIPMPILSETGLPDLVGVGGGKPNEHQPHAKRPL